jgi:hypothetical protein
LEILDFLPIWLVGLIFYGLLVGGAAIGRAWRARVSREEGEGDASLVMSASLGLLALLLGFTFSLVVSRHELRASSLVQESNAIEKFWKRMDFLPEDLRPELLEKLDRYVQARVDVSKTGFSAFKAQDAKNKAAETADSIWASLAAAEPRVERETTWYLTVSSASEMMSYAATRDAALAARLPIAVLMLMLLFPLASSIMIGFVYGKRPGLHTTASTELMILLTLTVLLILDLDRPRSGMVLNSQRPLERLDTRIQADMADASK